MEELWEKGEAGVDIDSFSHSPIVIEPEHFQSLFLIMGILHSIGLIFLLWDILSNPSSEFFKLMITGLIACLLITIGNIIFFSTTLWTPITRETKERLYYKGLYTRIGTPARKISTGEYYINIDILVNNKTVANVILGYGAVTSFIFIFIAAIRSLGKEGFPTIKTK